MYLFLLGISDIDTISICSIRKIFRKFMAHIALKTLQNPMTALTQYDRLRTSQNPDER